MSDCLIALVPGGAQPSRSELAALGFGLLVAGKLSGHCDALVLGPHATAAAPHLTKLGLRRVLVGDHADLAQPTGEALAAAISAVAKQGSYRLVGGPASTTARDSFPRVAARLTAPMASDVLEVRHAGPAAIGITKPCFSGNLLAEVDLKGPTVVATCRPSSFDPPAAAASESPLEKAGLPEKLAHARKQFVEMNRTPLSRPELTEADVIVSGGRGTKGDFQAH